VEAQVLLLASLVLLLHTLEAEAERQTVVVQRLVLVAPAAGVLVEQQLKEMAMPLLELLIQVAVAVDIQRKQLQEILVLVVLES